MKDPDIMIGKIIMGFILFLLLIIPYYYIINYIRLVSQCENIPSLPPIQTSKKWKIILIILGVIVLLSCLAAQAMNHSYPISKFKTVA